MVTEIEVKQRIDGKYNVWALIKDPTLPKADPTDFRRWVVVGVINKRAEAARYATKGTRLTFIETPKAA